MQRTPLKGKTALVTGAAVRIGREIALTLASAGANVVIHYLDSKNEAKKLADEIRKMGVESWLLKADLHKPEEYELLIDLSIEAAASLDILINNASEFPSGILENITFNDLMTNIHVNAWAPFFLSRRFRQKAGKGRIVNILDSRINGFDLKHTSYIISKHVLSVFTKITALEYAPEITVNAVSPGLILPPPGENERYIDRLKDTVPLKKHGSPKDVAEAVLFLVKSDFVTGEIINVDGGRNLKEYSFESTESINQR